MKARRWRVVEKTDGRFYLQQRVGLWPFRVWLDSASGPWHDPDQAFLTMEQRMAPRPSTPTVVRELDQ